MADTRTLAEKLKQAGGKSLTLALARLQLEQYFFAVSDMLGDGRFDNVFKHQVKPLMKGEHDLVSQFLHQLFHTKIIETVNGWRRRSPYGLPPDPPAVGLKRQYLVTFLEQSGVCPPDC